MHNYIETRSNFQVEIYIKICFTKSSIWINKSFKNISGRSDGEFVGHPASLKVGKFMSKTQHSKTNCNSIRSSFLGLIQSC